MTTRQQKTAVRRSIADIERDFHKLTREHADAKNRAKQAGGLAKRMQWEARANAINATMNELRDQKSALEAAVETIKTFEHLGLALRTAIEAGRVPA